MESLSTNAVMFSVFLSHALDALFCVLLKYCSVCFRQTAVLAEQCSSSTEVETETKDRIQLPQLVPGDAAA